MNTEFCRWIDAFAGLRVIVLGEAMLDTYLQGHSDHFCSEAPVPAVTVSNRVDLPGGAANTAVNAAGLGARVSLLSVVGDDSEGALIHQGLRKHGVCTEHLMIHAKRRTLSRQRVVADHQLLMRLDQGSIHPIDLETKYCLAERLVDLWKECDVVIVSDYRYGILTPTLVQKVGDLQARRARVLVVDSRRQEGLGLPALTAMKATYTEAMALAGAAADRTQDRAAAVAAQAQRLLDLTGAALIAVTLDRDGSLILQRGAPAYCTHCLPAPNANAVGAGDTYTATLALALAAGATGPGAGELAAAAAAVAVRKERTATCSAHELRDHLGAARKYVRDWKKVLSRLEIYRGQGRRIVFTNGCFDILHRGHVTFLHRAKALGDILVVGVNTDASIRRLKGPGRPVNALEDRLQVLEALACVDLVVTFEQDTPCELLRMVRPQVFVKGRDYTRKRLPEADLVEELGGVVHLLPYVTDRSTTKLIERIRQVPAPSAILLPK